MRNIKQIILASQSPRRKELLAQAGINFITIPADIEERIMTAESASEYVKRLSKEKAQFVGERNPLFWILGADTTVVIGDKILEKPDSYDHAKIMLKTLSGKEHIVYTGFTLCCLSESKIITHLAKTKVSFKKLSEREIDWYVNTGEPFDKAGGYAIQGIGAFMVKSINGSYSNVVGLPVCEVVELLIQEQIVEI